MAKNSKRVAGQMALRTVQRYFPHVQYVADATRQLLAQVTEHDNNHSLVKNHVTCALAVACKRTAHADGVIIGTRTAYIIHGKKAVRYRIAESAAREIVSFDREAGFAIGTYQLTAPCVSARLGAQGGAQSHADKPTGRKIQFRHYTTGIRTMLRGGAGNALDNVIGTA